MSSITSPSTAGSVSCVPSAIPKENQPDASATNQQSNHNNVMMPVGNQPLVLHQQYVDHSYSDYANFDEDDLRLLKETGDDKGAPSQAKILGITRSSYSPMKIKSSATMPFPAKLLEVLDRGDLNSIIDWMPHGRAFIVKQPKVFTTQVLQRFFKQTKFLSFTRQLNLWGFKRITRGLDGGAYYNELFLPGRPTLAMRMRRTKFKGTGVRPIPNPEREPNFYYRYPPVPRVPRSAVLMPLPPLPSERLANMMNGGYLSANFHPVQMLQPGLSQSLSQSSYMPQVTPSMGASVERNYFLACPPGSGVQRGVSAFSLKNSFNARSAVAEAHIRTSARSGLAPSVSTNLSKPSSGMSILDLELSKPSPGPSILDFELFSRSGASMRAAASRGYNPVTEVKDEASDANRRLMERLLNHAPVAPTLETTPKHTASAEPHRQSFRASMVSTPGGDTLLGRTIAAPPLSTHLPKSPFRRDSFKLQSPRHRTDINTTAPSQVALSNSLYSAEDDSLYMRGGVQSLPHLPSSQPNGAQDLNANTATNALMGAHYLVEFAQRQRAIDLAERQRAFADALHERGGYDDRRL